MIAENYQAKFYSDQVDGSFRSAKIILPHLFKYYQPESVVDFGCGRGGWLATAESLGSSKLKGFDGDWVKKEMLLSQNIDFTPIIFENNIDVQEKYDLCISVEVAEHINKNHAQKFIDTLCKCSNIVLFGAAIKEQGGVNHVNEQWQSYWISLFENNNYECLDIIRPVIWHNESVEWWYRQNIFIFVLKTSNLTIFDDSKSEVSPIVNIVHPGNYENKVKKIKEYKQAIKQPTLRFCLGCLKRYFLSKLK